MPPWAVRFRGIRYPFIAMHLVFLNQYYPPDAAPTGVMLAAVVERLAADGHAVTVICAAGGYAGRETLNVERNKAEADEEGGPAVLRIRATRFGRGTFVGKLMDYLSYDFGVAWRLLALQPRPDRVVALTTPPYLSVLARVLSKLRGADHAHWVMDLYPDVMVAHGMLREGSRRHRMLAGLARWGFGGKRRAAVLTLGPDMAERLARRRSNAERRTSQAGGRPAVWIPLWGTADVEHRTSNVEHQTSKNEQQDEDGAAMRRQRGWADDELIVMYSGNMGLGHRFGEILEIAVGLDCQAGPFVARGAGGGRDAQDNPEDGLQSRSAPMGTSGRAPAVTPCRAMTRFVFFGGGKRRGEIEAFVREHPAAAVELHDYAPAEILAAHLRSADVHLASLDAAWTGTMVPSKLQGIFGVGRPVIFVGDAESSIGRWVRESGGGWVVRPGDAEGLRAAIDEARDPQVRESRGRAAKAFADAWFDRETNVRRVAEVLAGHGGAS